MGATDENKTVVYMLRWVNTRGEKGPWSEGTTATVRRKEYLASARTNASFNTFMY